MATQRITVNATPQALQDLPGVRVGDVIWFQVDGLHPCMVGQFVSAPTAATAPGVRVSAYAPGTDDSLTMFPNSDPEKDWVWTRPGESETSAIVLNQSST